MIEMIRQETLKIIRRRGLAWTAFGLALLGSIAVLVTYFVVREVRPEDYTSGVDALDTSTGIVAVIGFVMAILIGATAGAWDVQHGTFRYLVLTGTPRQSLYWARVPALALAIVILLAPATVIAVVTPFLLPLVGAEQAGATDVAREVWGIFALAWVYGLVSFAVGALLQSVTAGIALALVLSFGGFTLLLLLDRVSETLGELVLPNALDRLVGDADAPSLGVAAAAVVVWLAVFLSAGAVRTARSEY